MKLSNSKVQTFRRCEKKYEFSYVMRLERKSKRVHLERGTWMHTLLEVSYSNNPNKTIEIETGAGPKHKRTVKVGTDWRRAHKALTFAFGRLFPEEQEELGDLPAECERMMHSYLHKYREENEHEETLAVELDEWVTLPNGDEFNFIIDRVLVKSDGGVWLRDYKTVGSFMPSDFMLIDAQLARYCWGFVRLPEFKPLAKRLRGVEFDEIRTKAPTVPEIVYAGTPREGLTKRSDLDTDLLTYAKAIKHHGLDPKDYRDILVRLRAQDDRFFRRTVLPRDRPLVRQMMVDMLVTSKEMKAAERRGEFPRTPDKSCTWGCDFLEPCMAQAQGADISNIVKLKYQTKERGGRSHRTKTRNRRSH